VYKQMLSYRSWRARATDVGPQRLARQPRAGPQRNCADHDWARRVTIRCPWQCSDAAF